MAMHSDPDGKLIHYRAVSITTYGYIYILCIYIYIIVYNSIILFNLYIPVLSLVVLADTPKSIESVLKPRHAPCACHAPGSSCKRPSNMAALRWPWPRPSGRQHSGRPRACRRPVVNGGSELSLGIQSSLVYRWKSQKNYELSFP